MGNLYEDAAQNIAKRSGQETDTDLATYNSLKPYHFEGLQRKYGFEDVRRYIVLMESKRLGIKTVSEVLEGK